MKPTIKPAWDELAVIFLFIAIKYALIWSFDWRLGLALLIHGMVKEWREDQKARKSTIGNPQSEIHA